MVTSGPTIKTLKREKKALTRTIERRAANSDKLIRELCEEIDRLTLLIVRITTELPRRRDWLDPDLEKCLRAIVEEHKRKAEDTPA
jgi:hypothetical protein